MAKRIYLDQFLPSIADGSFVVDSSIFSQSEVLDCLESETDSARAQAKLVHRTVSAKTPQTIVVVGAGSGRLGTQLQLLFSRSNLIEIDKNKQVVARLNKLYDTNLSRRAVAANIKQLPLNSNSVDLVIGYSVFRYLDTVEPAIEECQRILRQNGTLVISEAKDLSTISRVKSAFKQRNFLIQQSTIPTVRLPHLTFFYYLYSNYGTSSEISELIERQASSDHCSICRAAFTVAGSSLGSIYSIIWRKP